MILIHLLIGMACQLQGSVCRKSFPRHTVNTARNVLAWLWPPFFGCPSPQNQKHLVRGRHAIQYSIVLSSAAIQYKPSPILHVMKKLQSNGAIPDESIILEEREAMHPTSNTGCQLALRFVLIREQKLAVETCVNLSSLLQMSSLKKAYLFHNEPLPILFSGLIF